MGVSFNPRLPRGKATPAHALGEAPAAFQSTPSAREGDSGSPRRCRTSKSFNPRLPRGKATTALLQTAALRPVSIHAFREGRRRPWMAARHRTAMVSIHAFREGRRRPWMAALRRNAMVSIHAFREGRRPRFCRIDLDTYAFQSTPSAREGDTIIAISYRVSISFNPRLPRGKATP